MKREIKGKRCILNQDNSIIYELVDMIDNEKVVMKEEKNFNINLIEGDEQ